MERGWVGCSAGRVMFLNALAAGGQVGQTARRDRSGIAAQLSAAQPQLRLRARGYTTRRVRRRSTVLKL